MGTGEWPCFSLKENNFIHFFLTSAFRFFSSSLLGLLSSFVWFFLLIFFLLYPTIEKKKKLIITTKRVFYIFILWILFSTIATRHVFESDKYKIQFLEIKRKQRQKTKNKNITKQSLIGYMHLLFLKTLCYVLHPG